MTEKGEPLTEKSWQPPVPMKLESWDSSDDKRRWKVVRTDNYTDVPGEILTADEATGDCTMAVAGETKTLSFGPGGMRIVRRAR